MSLLERLVLVDSVFELQNKVRWESTAKPKGKMLLLFELSFLSRQISQRSVLTFGSICRGLQFLWCLFLCGSEDCQQTGRTSPSSRNLWSWNLSHSLLKRFSHRTKTNKEQKSRNSEGKVSYKGQHGNFLVGLHAWKCQWDVLNSSDLAKASRNVLFTDKNNCENYIVWFRSQIQFGLAEMKRQRFHTVSRVPWGPPRRWKRLRCAPSGCSEPWPSGADAASAARCCSAAPPAQSSFPLASRVLVICRRLQKATVHSLSISAGPTAKLSHFSSWSSCWNVELWILNLLSETFNRMKRTTEGFAFIR